tara:strand:+ start:2138 stop:2407 length:270 start_codon:yes stop_codon:yes gene_type:complete
VEGGFLDGGLNNRLGLLHAFTALGRDTKGPTYISKSAGTTTDGFLDLAIGYSFAKTNVHIANSSTVVIDENAKLNENHCQQIKTLICRI